MWSPKNNSNFLSFFARLRVFLKTHKKEPVLLTWEKNLVQSRDRQKFAFAITSINRPVIRKSVVIFCLPPEGQGMHGFFLFLFLGLLSKTANSADWRLSRQLCACSLDKKIQIFQINLNIQKKKKIQKFRKFKFKKNQFFFHL